MFKMSRLKNLIIITNNYKLVIITTSQNIDKNALFIIYDTGVGISNLVNPTLYL